MAVHLLEPVAPSENVPRMHPCAAWMDQDARTCGATPAWLYRRVCAHGHTRDVWLCNVHEAMVSRTGGGSCRDCMDLGRWAHRCPVALVKDPEAVALIRTARLEPGGCGGDVPQQLRGRHQRHHHLQCQLRRHFR